MHSPFQSLRKNCKTKTTLTQRAKVRQEPPGARDEDLFLGAVADVTPLAKGGREIVALPAANQPKLPAPKPFAQLLEEQIEFELEYTPELICGQVKGLDSKVFRKLKSGQFSIQRHLDLHGLNAEQAKLRVQDFVRQAYMDGKRCLLLIPGRGRNSPLGQGVLRQELSAWLTQAPLKRIILAFSTALPKDGGAGALYVLLRQLRKDKGKILWENIFTDFEG